MNIWCTIWLLFAYFICSIHTYPENVCTENHLVTYTNYVRRSRYVPYQHHNWLGFPKTSYRVENHNEPMVISSDYIIYYK